MLVLTHLYEIVHQRAVAYPAAIAFGGQQGLGWRTLTSRQTLDRVDRLSAELAAHGVTEGDRVVLWLPSGWRTPLYFFALWKLGAVVVPFDREMNPEAAGEIIASVEPRCIIAGYGERPLWTEGRAVTEWWEPGSVGSPGAPATPWARPSEELAVVMFTSGTTGNPKGCMITHTNLCSQVEALHDNVPLDPSCRLASILPLSHLFELTVGLLYPLSTGAAIHYIPSRRGPDIIRVLAEQRITHMIAVPQLLTMMGQALQEQLSAKLPAAGLRALEAAATRLPLSGRRRLFWFVHRKLGGQLRMMASGGAALPAETHEVWERLGVRIVQGYGASECSPVIACGAPDGSTPIGSVGRPIRVVSVRLGDEGELLVQGPNVMRGYWKDPARTAEAFQDGWYATGDLASIDQRGNIRLAGRAKDLIVLPSGMNIWPQDVEDVLSAHPAIKDSAVLAVPAAGGGATLHAYLIPAAGQGRDTDLNAIISVCNGRLAQHQRIATASWWPEADFPRTSTLKVRRNLLPPPESVAAVRVDAAAAADDPVGQAIAGAAHVAGVRPDQTLAELGLDSLGLVELTLILEEKTGKAVGDGDLHLDMTVAQVRAFLSGAPSLGSDGEAGHARVHEMVSARQPLWPYRWGRLLRFLGSPFDLLYRLAVTRTVVLGREHMHGLPRRVIFAGTHHSFADMSLVRHGLAQTKARRLVSRLTVAAAAGGFAGAGVFAWYSRLAFGLYPLRQYGDQDTSLRGLVQLAAKGNPVLIFPQGRHARPEEEQADEAAARFRPGVAHLAAALDAAVVPFGLAGTERMIPPRKEEFRGRVIAGIPVSITRGPLAIAFGTPLRLEPGESPQAFTVRLEQACFALTRRAEAALTRAA
jgi:long-chain acyl-CoA synthetase